MNRRAGVWAASAWLLLAGSLYAQDGAETAPAPEAERTPEALAPEAERPPEPLAPDSPTAPRGPYLHPDHGVGYRDPDLPLELRLRTTLALDYRAYDARNVRDSGAYLDRALVGMEGEAYGLLRFGLLADLRGIDTRYGLSEAWLSLEPLGERLLRLTGGVLPIPLGVEHSFPRETLPFLDYGFPARVSGRHDAALRAEGELGAGLVSWDVTFGFGEGYDLNGQRVSDPQLSGKLVSYPFRWLDLAVELGPVTLPVLSGLFVSAAVAHSWGWSSPWEVATVFRNKLVVTPRLEADRRLFWHLGYGIDLGPLRFVHEFTRGDLLGLETAQGSQDLEGDFSGMSIGVSLRLTGEPYDSRPLRQREARRVPPRWPLQGEQGWGVGRIEVGFRYSNSEWDRDLFQPHMFTNLNISSQEFRTAEFTASWWPVRTMRLSFHLTRVIADQFPGVFDSHGRDTSFLLRLQLDL